MSWAVASFTQDCPAIGHGWLEMIVEVNTESARLGVCSRSLLNLFQLKLVFLSPFPTYIISQTEDIGFSQALPVLSFAPEEKNRKWAHGHDWLRIMTAVEGFFFFNAITVLIENRNALQALKDSRKTTMVVPYHCVLISSSLADPALLTIFSAASLSTAPH